MLHDPNKKLQVERPLIRRKEALAQGLTRYFTGKLCPKGHVSEREVASCNCAECSREKARKYHATHKEENRKYNNEYRAKIRSKIPKRKDRISALIGRKAAKQLAEQSLNEIMSRKEARKQGSSFFFTNRPCSHGHVSVRYTYNGDCRECSMGRSNKRYQADPSATKQQSQKWR